MASEQTPLSFKVLDRLQNTPVVGASARVLQARIHPVLSAEFRAARGDLPGMMQAMRYVGSSLSGNERSAILLTGEAADADNRAQAIWHASAKIQEMTQRGPFIVISDQPLMPLNLEELRYRLFIIPERQRRNEQMAQPRGYAADFLRNARDADRATTATVWNIRKRLPAGISSQLHRDEVMKERENLRHSSQKTGN